MKYPAHESHREEAKYSIEGWADILAEYDDLTRKLDIAVNALEFYSTDDWVVGSECYHYEYPEMGMGELTRESMKVFGHTAKQALNQINKQPGDKHE